MKFAFIEKPRGLWPLEWLCRALEVSRGGFYAGLRRPPSPRACMDEKLSGMIRESFVRSDRTYGARRVRRDLRD